MPAAIQCRPVIQRLLPVEPMESGQGETTDDYIYEPEPAQLFEALLPLLRDRLGWALSEEIGHEMIFQSEAIGNSEQLYFTDELGAVIRLVPDQIVTEARLMRPNVIKGLVEADTERDLLKLAVLERRRAA